MADELEAVLAAYLRSVEQGRPMDQRQLLEQHPSLADELKSFFANCAALERIAGPLKGAALEATVEVGGPASLPPRGERPASSLSHDKVRNFGDYELLEEIARGGMGVVYKARQSSLNRVVAVKMILAGTLADSSAVKRFQQEAEAAANLDHPHIVPVYQVGEHEGQHYFSMGFVEGQSLAARLAGGPLAPREAAQLMEPVARAVQYAHDRGVIHRDLKPANVLLDRDGRPRVTDFGLAKLVTREQNLTDTGKVLGTPGYMPPEQVDGKPAGPQADVYGLGAILYALLTGRPPFQAATVMDTLLQVRTADPVPPRQLNSSVPRDLDTIVRKCLEKWPDWRYSSASELADELHRFLAGEPILARRPGVAEQGVRWFRKQSRSVALTVVAVVATGILILSALGGTTVYRKSLEGQLGLDTEHPRLTTEVRDLEEASVLPPFTVPTPQPVVLPEGEYTIRASGKELLSEDFSVRIERGQTQQFKLSLADQQLWPPIEVAGTATVVRYQENLFASVLDIHTTGIRFSAPSLKQDLWTRTFEPLNDPKLEAVPAFQWNWQLGDSNYGRYEYRPQVLAPCPQLDSDALCDLVIYCQHQPVVVALSANTGETLWAYAPAEIAEAAKAQKERVASGFFRKGTIAGPPLVMPDLDGDGTVDLIVASVAIIPEQLQDAFQLRRCIDAVSGKTGQRLWTFPIDPAWFTVPQNLDAPLAATWFARFQGTSGNHHINHPFGYNTFRHHQGHEQFGQTVLVPFPLQRFEYQGSSLVSCVAGTRLVLLDPKTGQEISPETAPLPCLPVSPPRIAQIQGVDSDHLLLVERTAPIVRRSSSQATASEQRLWMWGPRGALPAWQPVKQAADYEQHGHQFQPWPIWPLVADLNGDGQSEIVSPCDTSLTDRRCQSDARNRRAWGEIELISAGDGKSRWKRRLQTVDQQIDQFVDGPDIDGDGWRDLFAATIFSRGVHSGFVYVDAISAKTGEILWSSGQPIDMQGRSQIDYQVVGELLWWGDSRLVMPVIHGQTGASAGLFIFATADGKLLHRSADLVPAQVVDGDGDGLEDLFCIKPATTFRPDRRHTLHSFQGTLEPMWRRLGGQWQSGSDYNGDGEQDVVGKSVGLLHGEQIILSRCGRNGQEIWREAASDRIAASLSVLPLEVDLNSDGVDDLMAVDADRGLELPPLYAISGKTGRQLWQASFHAKQIDDSLLVEARDLDGDGRPELLYIVEMGFEESGGATQAQESMQLWLCVLDGETGKLRWKQMLNDRPPPPAEGTPRTMVVETADLNSDHVQDIVCPAVIAQGQYPELRAYDGRTGELLWHPVPLPGNGGQYVIDYLPYPTVADLDGDGKPEILVQDAFVPAALASRDVTQATRAEPAGGNKDTVGHQTSRIMALDGSTGQEKWRVDLPTGAMLSQTFDESRFGRDCRSRPLLVRRGDKVQPAICVSFYGGDTQHPEATIVLLRPDGQEVWRRPVKLTAVNRCLKVFSHDLTSDGTDELFFADGDSVQAVSITTKQPIWRKALLPNWMATILAIRPAGEQLQHFLIPRSTTRTMLALHGLR